MKLAFNEHGQIISSSGALANIEGGALAEMYRLNSFFGIVRGDYIFDVKFGNSAAQYTGKALNSEVLNSFASTLKKALDNSDLLNDRTYEITTSQTGRDSLSVNITDQTTGHSYAWRYDVRTNRLTKVVEVDTPSVAKTYQAFTETFIVDGFTRLLNIEALYTKTLVDNGLGIFDNIEILHNVYIQESNSAERRLAFSSELEIDMLNYTVQFYTAPPEGYRITVELWPSLMANLSGLDSPYLTRKYGV